jgi:hypothetical protein
MRWMGHDRRLVGLLAIAVGVSLVWGVGFGLIAGGALFGLSGVEPRPWLEEARVRWRRGWTRLRVLAARVPRQTAAVALVGLGAFALPVGLTLAAGTWAGLAAAGGLFLLGGVALGWE